MAERTAAEAKSILTPEAGEFVPFPTALLPDPFGPWVRERAANSDIDPCYIALPVLSALAAAIGNTRIVRMNAEWSEPCVVWSMIMGDSGTRKTKGMGEATAFNHARERDAAREYTKAMEEYGPARMLYDRAFRQWQNAGEDTDPPTAPTEPIPERYVCDDVTIEALCGLLRHQQRGLLLANDELSGFFGGFDAYRSGGRGSDVSKWLQTHNAGTLIVDRKAGGQVFIRRAAVSIAGGIQPGVLADYIGRKHRENGLLARFLIANPPRVVSKWKAPTRDALLEGLTQGVFSKLFALQAGTDQHGEPEPIAIRLSGEAEAAYAPWYNEHHEQAAALTGDLASAWAKLQGYSARLALVIHLVRGAVYPGEVDPLIIDAQTIAQATALTDWFKHEARRVYLSQAESPEQAETRRLIESVRAKGGQASPSALIRSQPHLIDVGTVEAAINRAVRAGHGDWYQPEHYGRGRPPSRVFRLYDPTEVSEGGLVRGRPLRASEADELLGGGTGAN